MTGIHLKLLEPDDYAPAQALIAEVLAGGDAALVGEWLPYWWDRNPYLTGDIPRGWVVRTSSGDVAGVMANIPVPYVINGRRGMCHAAGSLAVHPDWRGKGLARLIGEAYVAQTRPDLLIGTNSSPPALGLWTTLGMTELPFDWPQNAPEIVVSKANALERRLATRKVPRVVASAIRDIVALAEKRVSPQKELVARQADPLDPGQDGVIASLAASDAAIAPHRDVVTLNWLYFSTDFARRTRLLFTAHRDGELVGYAGFKTLNAQTLALLECRCLDHDAEIARGLIRGAGAHWGALGGVSMVCWPYTPMVAEVLPATRPSFVARPSFVYKSNLARLDADSWERTPSDGDMALF